VAKIPDDKLTQAAALALPPHPQALFAVVQALQHLVEYKANPLLLGTIEGWVPACVFVRITLETGVCEIGGVTPIIPPPRRPGGNGLVTPGGPA